MVRYPSGDAIGLATGRRDGPLVFQLAEGLEVEAAENPAVTGVKAQLFDFAIVVSNEFYSAALREQVKDALFGA